MRRRCTVIVHLLYSVKGDLSNDVVDTVDIGVDVLYMADTGVGILYMGDRHRDIL